MFIECNKIFSKVKNIRWLIFKAEKIRFGGEKDTSIGKFLVCEKDF